MSKSMKPIRVFIACPGGLEAERKAFRDIIEDYNISDANHSNIHFYPEGWEIVLGGKKRPQEKINKLVRECDYFVLVFHERWGSKTGNPKYSSGTEEEYYVALECCESDDFDMKDIVVFFKAVAPERIADPGPQLKKVLKFKEKLRDQKEIYYTDFDDLESLKTILRRHLAAWRRGHEIKPEERIAISEKIELTSKSKSIVSFNPEEQKLIDQANKYANEGKLLEAEEHFARAIVKGNNPAAFNKYGHFLDRVGRLSQAIVMYERVLELAILANDEKWEAIAYGNLGTVYQIRGDLKKAEEMHLKSLKIEKKLGRLEGMASDYGNLGLVYKTRGDLEKAEEMHLKSLEIEKKLGRLEGMANQYGNLGIVYRTRGDLKKAEEMHLKSLKISEKLGRLEGMANQYGNLGIIYRTRGDLKKAEEMHLKSLEIDKKLGRLEGMANQYGNLGLIYQTRGELKKAEEMHLKSLEIEKKLGRLEGMANQYGNLGIVYQTRGDLKKAEEMHLKSLKISEKLGRLEGMANQYGNLGIVYQTRGDLKKAEEMHLKSLKISEKLGRLEGMANQYGNLGSLFEKRGEIDKAKEYWVKALDLYKKIGIAHMVKKVQGWLDELGD